MTPLPLLALLVVAHCLCDFPLQGEFLSRAKRRGGVVGVPWWIALTAHAIIHAGAVWIITGLAFVGLIELVAHWLIDYWKCSRGDFGTAEQEALFALDQALHLACKFGYVVGLVFVALSR